MSKMKESNSKAEGPIGQASTPHNKQSPIQLNVNELAYIRTEQAAVRTIQAASRTYAAWVRTGFSIMSAGTAIGQFLKRSVQKDLLSNILSTSLITIGLLCFVYGWMSFRRQQKSISYNQYIPERIKNLYETDLVTISIMTVALVLVCVAAYVLQFLS